MWAKLSDGSHRGLWESPGPGALHPQLVEGLLRARGPDQVLQETLRQEVSREEPERSRGRWRWRLPCLAILQCRAAGQWRGLHVSIEITHLTPHTSYLTTYTSHLTHFTLHTSHITLHTSHFTPYTSHLKSPASSAGPIRLTLVFLTLFWMIMKPCSVIGEVRLLKMQSYSSEIVITTQTYSLQSTPWSRAKAKSWQHHQQSVGKGN